MNRNSLEKSVFRAGGVASLLVFITAPLVSVEYLTAVAGTIFLAGVFVSLWLESYKTRK